MHTSKDDYLINTLIFVSTKEATQIYGAILPKSLTSPEIKETKAYKTYLGFATGATPPKNQKNFKKPASPQLSTMPVSSEEPTKKSKRVKRSAKKSTKAPVGGVVIRETPKMPLSKKKEKVDVARGKGISFLSEAALTKEAQYEEVRRKSLRDFHKTYPSGSGTLTKTAPSVAKIKPSVTNEGTGVKPGVPNVTEEESSESEAESWENDEDDSNNEQDSRSEGSDEENESDGKNTQYDNEKGLDYEHESDNENESDSKSDHQENEEEDEDDEEEKEDELVKTPSNDFDDEAKITDKAKGDEDEEMDYTTKKPKRYSAGSDGGLKKRKTSKDAESTKDEPKFEVADSDMPQDQEENPGNDDEEPKGKVASKCMLSIDKKTFELKILKLLIVLLHLFTQQMEILLMVDVDDLWDG
nr:hypothetical protein [Tanacetum cinerariifolium]